MIGAQCYDRGLGFFHFISKIAHVAEGVGKGFATGGPAGAVAGGAKSTVSEIQKSKAAGAAKAAKKRQQQAYLRQHGMGDVDSEVAAAEAAINTYLRQRKHPVLRFPSRPASAAMTFSYPATPPAVDTGAGPMAVAPAGDTHWIGTIPNEDVAIAASLAVIVLALVARR
jgi:hypothetical protein